MSQSNSDKQLNLATFGGSASRSNQQLAGIMRPNYPLQSDTQQGYSASKSPMRIETDQSKNNLSALNSQQQLQQDSPYTPPRKHPLIRNITTSSAGGNQLPMFTPTTAHTRQSQQYANYQNNSGNGNNINSGLLNQLNNSQNPSMLFGSFQQQQQNKDQSASPINSYNKALDSVAILGNDFEQMLRQFESVQEELRIQRERCELLTQQLEAQKNDEQRLEAASKEIEKLNIIIECSNQKLEISNQKNKTLERKLNDLQGQEQKRMQSKEFTGNQETKLKQLEKDIATLKEASDQKDRKIADLEIVRISNTAMLVKVQMLERENAALKKQNSEKEGATEKLLSVKQQQDIEISKLQSNLLEFEKQCDLVHDEIDLGVKQTGGHVNVVFAKQIIQSYESYAQTGLEGELKQLQQPNPLNKGNYIEQSFRQSNNDPSNQEHQVSENRPRTQTAEIEAKEQSGRQIYPGIRKIDGGISGEIPAEYNEIPNPLQSSVDSSKNSLGQQEENFKRQRKSSSSNRLESLEEERKNEHQSSSGQSQQQYQQPNKIREYNSTLAYQKEFINDDVIQKSRENNTYMQQYGCSSDEIVIQGQPSRLDAAMTNIANSTKQFSSNNSLKINIGFEQQPQHARQFSGQLPPARNISDRLPLSSTTPKRADQSNDRFNQTYNSRGNSPAMVSADGAPRKFILAECPVTSSSSKSNSKQLATPELAPAVEEMNTNTFSSGVASQQLNKPNNQQVQLGKQLQINQTQKSSNLSVLMLSTSRAVRTVAVGENNMLQKIGFLRQQLQEKNAQIEMLQQKVEGSLQRAADIASRNADLALQSASAKAELEQAQQQLHDDFEQRKQEIEKLRQDWQKSIEPIIEEKKRLEEDNKSLSDQCEAFDKAMQDKESDNSHAIAELIEEKEQLHNFCEALQKEKESALLENLELREGHSLKSKTVEELNRENEDTKNKLSSKQKDIETWKLKYKSLKKEINGLKAAFDGYKQQVLMEVQNSIAEKSSNFRGVISAIKKKYHEQGDSALSSARESTQLQPDISRQLTGMQSNQPKQLVQSQGNQLKMFKQPGTTLLNLQSANDQGNQLQQQISPPNQITFSNNKNGAIDEWSPSGSQQVQQQQKEEQFLLDLKSRIEALKKIQADQEALRQLQSVQQSQQLRQSQIQQEHLEQQQQNYQQQSSYQQIEQQQYDTADCKECAGDNAAEGNTYSEEQLNILKSQYENALERIIQMSPQKNNN